MEVAVYNLASKGKRQVEDSPHVAAHAGHGHGHGHGHKHLHRPQRARRDMVVATIDGKVVSWENNWFGGDAAPTAKLPPVPAPAQAPPVKAAAAAALKVSGSIELGSSDKTDSAPKAKPAPSGSDWDRVAYYNAEKQIAENMTFMGHYGGSGSGVFDT